MAAAWPDYLRIEARGLAQRQDSDVERSTFDDGLVRQARRRSAALDVRSVTVTVQTQIDYARARAWLRDHAAGWFAWRDPDDGVLRRARVRGGAAGVAWTFRPGRSGAGTWEGRMEIEGLRSDLVAEAGG